MRILYGKISPDLFEDTQDVIERIILFDPSGVYGRIKIDKFSRRQKLSVGEMFPSPQDGTCACGCGVKLTGRKTRWATSECGSYANNIRKVIVGDSAFIKFLMYHYLPYKCCKCNCENYCNEKTLTNGIQVDHILAVKNGGGGCWLGNYQFICHRCHSSKTTVDNQLRNKQAVMPISTYFAA